VPTTTISKPVLKQIRVYSLHSTHYLADVTTVTSASTILPSIAPLKTTHNSHPFSDISWAS
jgi:hypothetical protein